MKAHSSKLRCQFLAMASTTLAAVASYPSFTSCSALPCRKISEISLTNLRRRGNCVPDLCLDQPRRTEMALKSRRRPCSPQPRSKGGRIRCILRSLWQILDYPVRLLNRSLSSVLAYTAGLIHTALFIEGCALEKPEDYRGTTSTSLRIFLFCEWSFQKRICTSQHFFVPQSTYLRTATENCDSGFCCLPQKAFSFAHWYFLLLCWM